MTHIKRIGIFTSGGDGNLKIVRKLAGKGGINMVFVPKTIDNDVGRRTICWDKLPW